MATFKMVDQSQLSPRLRTANFPYKELIEKAQQAAIGSDGLPRAVQQTLDTAKAADRAANAIRNHIRTNNLEMRVFYAKDSKDVAVYRAKPVIRGRNKPASEPKSTTDTDAGEAA